ncbi:hypothetical protein ACQEVZ_09455 [Dactylosporangium sp. CA-152071]|uniref:hypothetical protein n=1 Tax=Dactylosporangium sp. CA-152071 TaxID=3239933 RepID=UPI003D8DC6A9
MTGVAWERVYGCDGTSEHVPALLEALTAAEPETRARARNELSAHLYHQGTRWQASAVVVPFLVALADDPATPDRADLLRMLRKVAIGDHRDDALPFDARAAYPAADAVTDEQLLRLNLWLTGDDEAGDDEAGDAGADRWARDAYDALAAHARTVTGWVGDADPAVAELAAGLLAWLPPTPSAVAALLGTASAAANLTLAHLPVDDPAVDTHLRGRLDHPDRQVALTAAIALAYRHRAATPEPALTMIAVAADPDGPLPPDVPGWDDRALRGFVALALARIGW